MQDVLQVRKDEPVAEGAPSLSVPAADHRREARRGDRGFAVRCGVCGAFSAESNRLSPKFRDPCNGKAVNGKTRWKELDAIKSLQRGVHPVTKVKWEVGRPTAGARGACVAGSCGLGRALFTERADC